MTHVELLTGWPAVTVHRTLPAAGVVPRALSVEQAAARRSALTAREQALSTLIPAADELALRGAKLGGADLSAVIGLTPSQIAAAHIDSSTRLPGDLSSPTS